MPKRQTPIAANYSDNSARINIRSFISLSGARYDFRAIIISMNAYGYAMHWRVFGYKRHWHMSWFSMSFRFEQAPIKPTRTIDNAMDRIHFGIVTKNEITKLWSIDSWLFDFPCIFLNANRLRLPNWMNRPEFPSISFFNDKWLIRLYFSELSMTVFEVTRNTQVYQRNIAFFSGRFFSFASNNTCYTFAK